MLKALRDHWREYLIEAFGLGIFLVLVGGFATVIFSPASIIAKIIPNDLLQRALMGSIAGLTAISLIYSPWGKRSGAHFNPAVSIAFFRLKKLAAWDTLFYVLAQFVGGTLGVLLVGSLLGNPFTDKPVEWIVTIPGSAGWSIALIAEFLMSLALMLMVLCVSNHPKLSQFTGIFAGIMVATFITIEAPLSGMSINPARSFASAFSSHIWTDFWIYYFAPPLAMLLAAELYLRYPRRAKVLCGKLCPNQSTPCLCQNCCCCNTPN